MFKKVLAILLAAMMTVSLVACEAAAPAADTKAEAEETEAEAAEEAEPAEEAEAAEGEEAAEEETEPWVWEGEKYDDLWTGLGKADIELPAELEGQLKSVIDAGVLVIGTSPDYPAAEFIDIETGEVKGCEILLAKYIANSLGVDLQIETMDFGAILAAVDTGKIDLAISGYGYKADRAEQYELSHGYQSSSAAAHHTILVKTSDLDQYNSLEDFNGKMVDAQANSLQQMYMEDQVPGATLQLVATLDQAVMEILAGRIDAVALDATTARNYSEQSEGQLVSMYEAKGVEFDLSMYSDYAGNVCAVKKGETQFIDVVNAIIDDVLAQDGLYSTWYYAACDAAGIVPSEDE